MPIAAVLAISMAVATASRNCCCHMAPVRADHSGKARPRLASLQADRFTQPTHLLGGRTLQMVSFCDEPPESMQVYPVGVDVEQVAAGATRHRGRRPPEPFRDTGTQTFCEDFLVRQL